MQRQQGIFAKVIKLKFVLLLSQKKSKTYIFLTILCHNKVDQLIIRMIENIAVSIC